MIFRFNIQIELIVLISFFTINYTLKFHFRYKNKEENLKHPPLIYTYKLVGRIKW